MDMESDEKAKLGVLIKECKWAIQNQHTQWMNLDYVIAERMLSIREMQKNKERHELEGEKLKQKLAELEARYTEEK